jgi:multisubunit Na+/H+ antiporter MnhF subunit
MWTLNPPARPAFASMGPWALVLLGTVSVWSTVTAIGLLRGQEWGRRLAMLGLALNACGDLTNAIVRHDPRTLIGVPVVAVLLAYLTSARVRRFFAQGGSH